MLRQALRQDITAMHRVRLSVHENRLTSAIVTEADYLPAIEETGRGWVVEVQGNVVGFAIGNIQDGNIWALFIEPGHERQGHGHGHGHGHGRALHDAMVAWLWSQGLRTLWLTTAPGTRAQHFYESAGWQRTGQTKSGELMFELCNPN